MSNGYGKRPLWQWIVLYVIVGGIAYAFIYYFFFAGKGGYLSTAPTPAPSEQVSELAAHLLLATSPTLGEYLTAANGMTLYVSSQDTAGVSNCSGTCAVNWPPYAVSGADELSVQEGISGEVSTLQREDGSLQVTYKGMPLYFWIQDRVPGDTTGHGVGTFSIVSP